MGIKGVARRSADGHFIHCNVDLDIIVAEEVRQRRRMSCRVVLVRAVVVA